MSLVFDLTVLESTQTSWLYIPIHKCWSVNKYTNLKSTVKRRFNSWVISSCRVINIRCIYPHKSEENKIIIYIPAVYVSELTTQWTVVSILFILKVMYKNICINISLYLIYVFKMSTWFFILVNYTCFSQEPPQFQDLATFLVLDWPHHETFDLF